MHEGRKRAKTWTVSTEEFESRCPEMIDLVEKNGYAYIITKDGQPIAMMKPVTEESAVSGEMD